MNRGTRRAPLIWIEILTVADAGGVGGKRARTDAKYVTVLLNGAKRSRAMMDANWRKGRGADRPTSDGIGHAMSAADRKLPAHQGPLAGSSRLTREWRPSPARINARFLFPT